MFFYVEIDDGDKFLLPYSKNLSSSAQFEDFAYLEPQLFPPRFNAADALKRITAMQKAPIRNIQLHDVFFRDLRYWGYAGSDTRNLPDAYVETYNVPCEYVAWHNHGRYRYVQVHCSLVDEILSDLWHHYFVYVYDSIRTLSDAHTLIYEQFCLVYPNILPPRNRERLFHEFVSRV